MENYYDKKLSKNYIITGHCNYVQSYDYNKKAIYHKYEDKNSKDHSSVIINDKDNVVKLIESGWDGNVRIWNFHSGSLLKKIRVAKEYLFGICLLNNETLLVGCGDKIIRLIELKSGKIIKELAGHNKDYIITIRKLIFPKYGECFISQGWKDDQIKLWIIGKKI